MATTSNITGQIQGADAGMGVMTSNTFALLYGLMFIVNVLMTMKDSAGAPDFNKQMTKSIVTLVVIALFFCGPLTSNITLTDSSAKNTTTTSAHSLPIGIAYPMAVVDGIMGYLSTAISAQEVDKLGQDLTDNPFAYEQNQLKLAQAASGLKTAMASSKGARDYYTQNCFDPNKLTTAHHNNSNLAYNVQDQFNPVYMKVGADTKTCAPLGQQITNVIEKANSDMAAATGLDPNSPISQTSNGGFFSALADAEKDFFKALIIEIFSLTARIAAWMYAIALPYFTKIITMMYFAAYPIVVARSMFPGQFGVLIVYIEGYAWLMFIPIIVKAVEFSHMAGFAGVLAPGSGNAMANALIDIAKFAIVMSAPMLASFLLFGQRSHHSGLAGVSGAVAGGMMMAASMATRGAIGGAARSAGGSGGGRGGAGGGTGDGQSGGTGADSASGSGASSVSPQMGRNLASGGSSPGGGKSAADMLNQNVSARSLIAAAVGKWGGGSSAVAGAGGTTAGSQQKPQADYAQQKKAAIGNGIASGDSKGVAAANGGTLQKDPVASLKQQKANSAATNDMSDHLTDPNRHMQPGEKRETSSSSVVGSAGKTPDGQNNLDFGTGNDLSDVINGGEQVGLSLKDPQTGESVGVLAQKNGTGGANLSGMSAENANAVRGSMAQPGGAECSLKEPGTGRLVKTNAATGSDGRMSLSAVDPADASAVANMSSRMDSGGTVEAEFGSGGGAVAPGNSGNIGGSLGRDGSGNIGYSLPAGATDSEQATFKSIQGQWDNGVSTPVSCNIRGHEFTAWAGAEKGYGTSKTSRGGGGTLTSITYGIKGQSQELDGKRGAEVLGRIGNGFR